MLNIVVRSLTWLLSLWRDEVQITVAGDENDAGPPADSLLVRDHGSKGLLALAISSTSPVAVDLVSLAISYATPLQLGDPDRSSFFKNSLNENVDDRFPFKITWEGSANIGQHMIQRFAVALSFPGDWKGQVVSITLHTRRSNKRLGFVAQGRVQETTVVRTLIPVTSGIKGIAVHPGWGCSSPQPWINRQEQTATLMGTEVGSTMVNVHELLDGSQARSTTVEVKRI